MIELNIITNAFDGELWIRGINDKAPLVDQLVYVTLEAYKGVCKKYKKSNPDYMELRAYYIGHLLKDVLGWWGHEVKEVLRGSPVTCEAIIDEGRKITCKVEFETHKYFIDDYTARGDKVESIRPSWGFCNAHWKSEKRPWPLKDKVYNMDIHIGVKFTDPNEEKPVDPGFMFDSAIHEVIHLIDDIRKHYSKNLAFKIAEPLLKRVLTRFFVFGAIKNYTEND